MSNDREQFDWMKTLYWGLALVAVGVFLYSVWLTHSDWPSSSDAKGWSEAGTKGDFWGGHWAAASGLISAILFFIAILLQRSELKTQREELQLTRAEMANALEVYKAQERHMAEQKEIAIHSSIAHQLTEICRLRNELAVQSAQFELRGAELSALKKRYNASIPILVRLLHYKGWTREERQALAILAGAKDSVVPETCDRVYEEWFFSNPESRNPI